jgi:hypothetical protein
MLPPSLIVPFADDISHSSPRIWNKLFSDLILSPSFLDEMKQDLDSSPIKVVHTETKLMANLKVETPLTPVSTRSKHFESGVYPCVNKNLTVPLTPTSPPIDTSRLETKLFNENLTAETSLRLAVLELPSPLPRVSTFPLSMFAVFIAQDDKILEVWRSDDTELGGREQEQSEFSGILDVVRKRKAAGGETHLDAWQNESKQKYSQQSRVGEFMTLHGHDFHRVPNEEIPGTMMIRKYPV